MTRLRTDLAINLITVFGWAYSWCLLWLLGERVARQSRAGGVWTAIATLFGGGTVAFLRPFVHRGGRRWVDCLMGTYSLSVETEVNPPIVSYIFQHPYSLGLPLGITALLASCNAPAKAIDAGRRGVWARHVLLGLILAALSITQSIMFVTLLGTLAFTEIVVARRWRFAVVLACVMGAARVMGGTLFHADSRRPVNRSASALLAHVRFSVALAAAGAGLASGYIRSALRSGNLGPMACPPIAIGVALAGRRQLDGADFRHLRVHVGHCEILDHRPIVTGHSLARPWHGSQRDAPAAAGRDSPSH